MIQRTWTHRWSSAALPMTSTEDSPQWSMSPGRRSGRVWREQETTRLVSGREKPEDLSSVPISLPDRLTDSHWQSRPPAPVSLPSAAPGRSPVPTPTFGLEDELTTTDIRRLCEGCARCPAQRQRDTRGAVENTKRTPAQRLIRRRTARPQTDTRPKTHGRRRVGRTQRGTGRVSACRETAPAASPQNARLYSLPSRPLSPSQRPARARRLSRGCTPACRVSRM
jgi:hypothetical protein